LRSTSGAYGDFPDYYYTSGNLFGTYLLGKAAPMSRDTRRELETLGGGYPVVRPTPRPTRQDKLTPHAALMNYVRASVTPEGAKRIIAALAQHRGVAVPELSAAEPYELLDRFAIEHLSARDQVRIRVRLEKAARELATEERKRRRRSAKRPKKAKASGQAANSRNGRPGPPAGQTRARPDRPQSPTVCALCGATLTRAEQTRCAHEPKVFLSQAYCTEHADRVRALFATQS
jgi:hypothetical protein